MLVRRLDDIAKRHLGDGVALFCIINEHSRLNNTYREDNKQNTKPDYATEMKNSKLFRDSFHCLSPKFQVTLNKVAFL